MNIDLFSILITFILSVVGILITIVIRKKHKITFFNQKSINLFNYITKEIKDIEIKYKKENVGVNIYLLKGVILNTGNIDIDSNIVFEPLKMILPQNYSWLEFRIGKKSDNLNISSEKIKNNIIKINWDLFKKNEFFSFNSLILTDGKKESREEITKIINFSYRITNLNEIKKRNAESIINKKNWYSDYILPLIGILFFLIIGIITLLRPTIDSYKINEDKIKYILREEEGIKNVSFYIGKNNELIVKDKNGDVYIKGKPSDILKDYNIEPTFNIDYKKNQIVNKVIGISFVVLFLPLFVFVFINMLQDRKIYYYYYKQNND